MRISEFPREPDRESSTADYQSRFSGEVGKWFLDVQSKITARIIRDLARSKSSPLRVLDVGGGHGQNVETVLSEGHHLTVLGSNEGCGSLLTGISSDNFQFITGNLLSLPFDDDEYDLVLSYRIMAHISDWRCFAGELHRVSNSWVAIDYPTTRSVNVLSAVMYPFKRGIEKNSREYRLFKEAVLKADMSDIGLRPRGRYPQFLFPMALHRVINIKMASQVLEALASAIRMTSLLGSPVIAVYEKADKEFATVNT